MQTDLQDKLNTNFAEEDKDNVLRGRRIQTIKCGKISSHKIFNEFCEKVNFWTKIIVKVPVNTSSITRKYFGRRTLPQ